MSETETILCAAIWYKDLPSHEMRCKNTVEKGLVVTGWRHGNVIDIVKTLGQLRSVKLAPDGVGENVQGFITNTKK